METVRQYARDRLMESGEGEPVRHRGADYYRDLAQQARPHLSGPQQRDWLERLEAEHDNLRAALEWRSSNNGDVESSLDLGAALANYWRMRGHLGEGRAQLEALLFRPAAQPPTLARATAFVGAGNLCRLQGDFEAARTCYEEALGTFRGHEDRRGLASTLNELGLIAKRRGRAEQARALHEESLALFEQIGDTAGAATVLGNLGNIAQDLGDYASAWAYQQ
jgi:non-specific serine/threonine protein kinase